MVRVSIIRNRTRRRRNQDGSTVYGAIQSVQRRPTWFWLWMAGQRRKPWPEARHVNMTDIGPVSIRVSWGKPTARQH
jgi:hypothetical protein